MESPDHSIQCLRVSILGCYFEFMSRRQWQRVPGSRDREWHIFAGMNAMTCHVVLGKGSQDPYEIQTGRSF